MTPEVFGIATVVAAIGAIGYAVHRHEKRRTEAMQAVCHKLGFRWAGQRKGSPESPLPLFNRGHSHRIKHAMAGEVAGQNVTVMEYRYVIGSGKNQTSYNQTVVLLPEGGSGLPDFELAPENVFHKLGQVFGYQDIDFAENEKFSSQYLLRGDDEAAIRRVFNGAVLAFLAGRPGWTVQSRAAEAVVFRARKTCKPEGIPTFLADALQILGGLGARGAA